MTEFGAHAFVAAFSEVSASRAILNSSDLKMRSSEQIVPADAAVNLIAGLDAIKAQLSVMNLSMSIDHIERMKANLNGGKCTMAVHIGHFNELQNRMLDEIKGRYFLTVPEPDAEIYYREQFPFGPSVADKLPKLALDIQEASTCLALERPTACVFHLMRVMESEVQRIGRKLGVVLTGEKTWQRILDDLNHPIKALPEKTRAQKARKRRFTEAHAYLFSVKLSWRNEVMHPKASYSSDEAKSIFAAVKTFVSHSATKL